MKCRTTKNTAKDSRYYIDRGISICEEWLNFEHFYEWAMANGYEDHLTIERDDVNGNYEPSNCKWILPKEQARNKRNNHFITFRGQIKTLAEWGEILGMETSLIRYRLKSWKNVEEALSTPVGRTNYETIKTRAGKL